MPIMSNAQQPQVDGAVFGNDSLISLALARQVFCTAVRKPGSAKIRSVEQVLLHKIMVALLMESIQSTIFVQINGSGLGKIQIAGSIPPSQIPVSANRGRTSSQP